MPNLPVPEFEISLAFAATNDVHLIPLLRHLRLPAGVKLSDVRSAVWEHVDNEMIRADETYYSAFTYYRAVLGTIPIIAIVSRDSQDGTYFFGGFRKEIWLREQYEELCAHAEAKRQEMIHQVTINGRTVSVELAAGIVSDRRVGWEKIRDCALFRDYIRAMDPRFFVRHIVIQSVDFFFGGRIGFIKLSATIHDAAGVVLPGIAFLRGGSVAILVLLTCEGNDYIALVKQARSPIGKYDFMEIPAGMLDSAGNFTGKAAAELEEELGISIAERELIDLTELAGFGELGIYTSPGGSDEFFRIMLHRQTMSREELAACQNGARGVAAENEVITTVVLPFDDFSKFPPDSKSLTALFLYERLRKLGKI